MLNSPYAPSPPASTPAAPVLAVDTDGAAAALGVSVSTIRRMAASGELRRVKIGGNATRFRIVDLEEYLARAANA
jgi:excisionase family DNA binding protein